MFAAFVLGVPMFAVIVERGERTSCRAVLRAG
jgi:hypothetical protein